MIRSAFLSVAMMIAPNLLAGDRVLVVTATAGFRHDSIPTAEEVIAAIGEETRWFDATVVREEADMPAALSPAALANVKLVMFVNTTGELSPSSRAPLLAWIHDGGTFLGLPNASDTGPAWPAYTPILAGHFHPPPAHPLPPSRAPP